VCEVYGQTTRVEPVFGGFDLLNERAVITLGENTCNFVFEIQALAKDDRRH
jgi:hypothetical protein